METKGNDINIDLIVRHLSGETDPGEEQQLANWLESGKENRRLFGEYKKLWNKLDEVSSVASTDLDREWRLFESRIRSSSGAAVIREEGQKPGPGSGAGPYTDTGLRAAPQSGADAENRKASPAKRRIRKRSIAHLPARIAIAAAIAFVLAFLGLYVSGHMNRTFRTASATRVVQLQDGSMVTLNRNSRFSCPLRFKKNLRELSLEGEAYFEVQEDPGRPFLIHAGEIDVRVLGTAFNVSAYSSNKEVEVIVKTGTVAVTRSGDSRHTVLIEPGSKAVYHKPDGKLEFSREIDRNYLAWKTKNLVFDDMELGEVVSTLNEVYGSDISISSGRLRETRITTSFQGQTLDAILNVLAATLDLKITRSGDRILLEESE